MAMEKGTTSAGWMPHTFRWMLVAPALLILWIVGQIDKTNISLIIANDSFIRDLNLSGHNAELGGLMGYFLLGYGGAIFLWGFLVDRFGPRICAIVGIICWGSCLYLSSKANTIGEMMTLRFFLGVAEGNLWPVGNALTNRWFPIREHSRAQAFWVAGSSLGTAIGVPIVTYFILGTGWRGTLAWLSLISLIPVIFFAFIHTSPREQKGITKRELEEIESGQKEEHAVQKAGIKELLLDRAFWLLMMCQFVSATSIFTLVQWIPRFLTTQRHLTFREMGNWISLGYILATALTLLICYLADRTMQRPLAAMWICLIFAAAVLPTAFLLSPIVSALMLSTLLVVAPTTAALNGAIMHRLVRPEVIARGTGIYVGVGNGLAGIGPTIFGYLITRLGGQFWGGFAFLAGLSVFGAICYFALHRIAFRAPAQANVYAATVAK